MSQKAFNSFLLSTDPNVFFEPVKTDLKTDSDNSYDSLVALKRSTRAIALCRAATKRRALRTKRNDLNVYILKNPITEPVIRPEVYALALLGRGDVTHEVKGSSRDEMRESLMLALKQMPG